MVILVAAYYAAVAAGLALWLRRSSLWFTSFLAAVVSQALLFGGEYLYRGHWNAWNGIALVTSSGICVAVVGIVAVIFHHIRSEPPRITPVAREAFDGALASMVALGRAVCLFFALFDLIGTIWFLDSQRGWLEAIMWPAPWCALFFGALAPSAVFRDSIGIAAAAALYLVATAELIRRIALEHAEGSTLATWITSFEIGLLAVTFLGRFMQDRIVVGKATEK